MAILSAQRERKPRGIGKAAGRAMNHLRDQRQSLQRAWSEILHQKKRSKVAKIALISDGKDGAQALQIDVISADIMVCGKLKIAKLA